MQKFTAKVTYQTTMEAIVSVEANSQDEARDAIYEKAFNGNTEFTEEGFDGGAEINFIEHTEPTAQDVTSTTPDAYDLKLRSDMAISFYDELLDATESFGAIAEMYGQETLVSLIYLQAAILKGTFIEVLEDDDTRIVDVVMTLPSAVIWLGYIDQNTTSVVPVDITDENLALIESSLSNDENSSDEELVQYFVDSGIPEAVARASLQYRDRFMNGIMETGSLLKLFQGIEATDFLCHPS